MLFPHVINVLENAKAVVIPLINSQKTWLLGCYNPVQELGPEGGRLKMDMGNPAGGFIGEAKSSFPKGVAVTAILPLH